MDMVIPWTKVWAVVITGLVVVFLALVLLIIFVSIFGKIFTGIGNASKNRSSKPETPAVNITKSAPPVSAPAAPVTAEDDTEVIAVISAAVAMMAAQDGKNYAVKSIKRTDGRRRQGSVWGSAGQHENTLPF